jgi:TRAP-type uncharacterized transport system fused permease subunit
MLTWKYTLPAFLVPFVFTLTPEGLGLLMQAPVTDIAWTFATAAAGIAAIAAGLSGWIRPDAGLAQRAGLVGGGLLLCYAGRWTDLAGIAITAVVLVLQLRRRTPAHTAHDAS